MSTFFQERFLDIINNPSDIVTGKVLQYDLQNKLNVVYPNVESIQPQIVVYVDTSDLASGYSLNSVTCTGGGVTLTGVNQGGKYIFNLPTLDTYICTAIATSSGFPDETVSDTVEVTQFMQYRTNLIFSAS